MKLKKTTCNALMLGIALSISCNNTKINANIEYVIEGISLIAGPALTYLGVAAWVNYQYKIAMRRNQILEQFAQDGDYEALKNNACKEYFKQPCIYKSSSSLSSDYPVIWLEKNATSKKNFLGCCLMSSEKKALARKLKNTLKQLRKNQQFKEERREYNREHRDITYKNTKNNRNR